MCLPNRDNGGCTKCVLQQCEWVLFNKYQTTLINYPGGKGGSYTIPSSVTVIGNVAFATCAEVTSIYIPSSVTNIRIEPTTAVDMRRTQLIAVRDGFVQTSNAFAPVSSGPSRGLFDFKQCGQHRPGVFMMRVDLTGVTMPTSVTQIGDMALNDG